MNHLDKSISLLGGVTRLAHALGITQAAVSNWRARGTPIDPIYCSAIELLTGGKVTRKNLRPGDWYLIWPELVKHKLARKQKPKGSS